MVWIRENTHFVYSVICQHFPLYCQPGQLHAILPSESFMMWYFIPGLLELLKVTSVFGLIFGLMNLPFMALPNIVQPPNCLANALSFLTDAPIVCSPLDSKHSHIGFAHSLEKEQHEILASV